MREVPFPNSSTRHGDFVFDQGGTKCTAHVVLHRNGDPIHFDITIDFQRVAETLGGKAEKQGSTSVAGGFVKVRHLP